MGHGSAVRVRVTGPAAAIARAINLCHSTGRAGRLRVAHHIACYAIFARIKPSIVAKRPGSGESRSHARRTRRPVIAGCRRRVVAEALLNDRSETWAARPRAGARDRPGAAAPDGRSPRWFYRVDPWAWRLRVPATAEERQDRREVSVDSLGCWGSGPDPRRADAHSRPDPTGSEARPEVSASRGTWPQRASCR